MTSAKAKPGSQTPAEAACTRLAELSADLRGCAVLDSGGAVLASRGDWAAGAPLLESEGAENGERAPIDGGEAFVVRGDGLALVAVAGRSTLAELLLFDMRVALRAVAAGAA
ncbi:MAG: hypothetical protein ACRDK1_06275 [Solirubrobacterales bacterium]